MHGIILFTLSLIIMHVESFSYVKEAGNTKCGSVSNRKPILDKAACEAAATSMGLDDVEAYETSSSYRPPGCSFQFQTLVYNTLSTSTKSCTWNSFFCLCVTAPICTHTNRATSNTDACFCGETGLCTTVSGLYCYASNSQCSLVAIPDCLTTDGSAANDVACTCGGTECTSGLFCYAEASQCSTTTFSDLCPIRDGSAANTVACTCGSVECTSDTGLICYSTYGGGSCRKTGFGPFGYIKVEGYTTCGSVSNRKPILDKAACEAAATSMGLDDVEAYVESDSFNPYGCRFSCYDSGCYLYYNTRSTSTEQCQWLNSFCLCVVVPDCTHTNGVTSNTDACLCGGIDVRCTAASGLFCDASISQCATVAYCTHTNGVTSNTDACLCGGIDVRCTTASGLFCDASISQCATVPYCTHTNGVTSNTDACLCGGIDVRCTAASGLFCDASISQCSLVTIPDCLTTDGSTVNDGDCKCGEEVLCKQGNVCLEWIDNDQTTQNSCSYYQKCANTDGRQKQITQCACGSVDCLTTEGFCQESTSTCATVIIPQCNNYDGRLPNDAPCRCNGPLNGTQPTSSCSSGQYCYDQDQVCANFSNPRIKDGRILPLCNNTNQPTEECLCGGGAVTTICSQGQYCKFAYGSCWDIPVDEFLSNYRTVRNGSCANTLTEEECQRVSPETALGRPPPSLSTTPVGPAACYLSDNNYTYNNVLTDLSDCSVEYPCICQGENLPQCPDVKGVQNNTDRCLCAMGPTVDNTSTVLVTGGFDYITEEGDKRCADTPHRKPILDKAMCEAAATSMDLDEVEVVLEESSSNAPPGCYSRHSSLYYNTKSTSTTTCDSTYSDFCLCTQQQSSTCRPDQFCITTDSIHRGCVDLPVCTSTNGEAPNTEKCRCALLEEEYFVEEPVFCPANNYCDAATNGRRIESCSLIGGEHVTIADVTGPLCPMTTGLVSNIDACICETPELNQHLNFPVFALNAEAYIVAPEDNSYGLVTMNTLCQEDIATYAACNAAATALRSTGLIPLDPYASPQTGSWTHMPSGCVLWSINEVHWNQHVHAVNKVDFTESRITSRICASVAKTDATGIANGGLHHGCFTGMYCNHKSGCSLWPTCLNEDGTTSNAQECQCGSNVCSSNKYCYAPQSLCHSDANMRKTTYINGQRPAFEYLAKTCAAVSVETDCICGSDICPAGSACNNGTCVHLLECVHKNGNVANSAACTCGDNAMCWTNTGMYCHATTLHNRCDVEPSLLPVKETDDIFTYVESCSDSFTRNTEECHCYDETGCNERYCIDGEYCSTQARKCAFSEGTRLHEEKYPNDDRCSCSEGNICMDGDTCWPDGLCSTPKCRRGFPPRQGQESCPCYESGNKIDDCAKGTFCYNPSTPTNGQSAGCIEIRIIDCDQSGTLENTNICLCNNEFCTPGQYCNGEHSICSDLPNPICRHDDGLRTNDATCLCMDTTGNYEVCNQNKFCNRTAPLKCHNQYCKDYKSVLNLCNVVPTIDDTIVYYGNGLVSDDHQCTTTAQDGFCQEDSWSECCKPCPSDRTHVVGTGMCESPCDTSICHGEWVVPPVPGSYIDSDTTWDDFQIQYRLNPKYTGYCSKADCETDDQEKCCVQSPTCPVGQELALCHEIKHTRNFKKNATCNNFECTAADCCEVRECVCPGGVPKPAYDCTATGHVECDYCDRNHWRSANKTCSPIVECLLTQYETAPPTPRIRNRQCQNLTVCENDEYIVTNETIRAGDNASDVYTQAVAVSDRRCQNRTKCNYETEYQAFIPNLYQNRHCSPLTQCDTEQYAIRRNVGQLWTSDSNCTNKTVCKPEQYVVSHGTTTIDRTCSAISPKCANGTTETQVAIPGVRNRFCQTPRTCKVNEYETQAPNATQNRECAPITNCSETQFQIEAPTNTSDRVCIELSICLDTQFESSLPNETSDRICSNITSCDPDQRQYETQAPTPTSNRVCTTCTDTNCVGCTQETDCTFDANAKISYEVVTNYTGTQTCSGHTCDNLYIYSETDVFERALEYGNYYRFNAITTSKTFAITGVEMFKGRVAMGTTASINNGEFIYFHIPMDHVAEITYQYGVQSSSAFSLQRDCQQKEEYVGSGPVCTSVCGTLGAVLLKRVTTHAPLGAGKPCLSKWTSSPCVCQHICPTGYVDDLATYLNTPKKYKGTCFTENCNCPIDCEYTQNDEFEPCDATCGEVGYKIKQINITVNAAHKGTPCPAFAEKVTCVGDRELMLAATYENQYKCDCDGHKMDRCDICGGKNQCVGCDGVPVLPNDQGYRKKVTDQCGICGGDGSTCAAKFKLMETNKKTTSHTLKLALPVIIAGVVTSIFVAIFVCTKKLETKYEQPVKENQDNKAKMISF